jgi:iron(III) transport system permease protein
MARPVAAPAFPASLIDVVRAAGVGVALLLAVFIAWPVVVLLVQGLLTPVTTWPWRIAIQTLAVALSSAFVALVLAALAAFTVTRMDVPGRALLWQVFRIGALMPPFIVSLALLVLAGVLASGGVGLGFTTIVVGQSLAFLPHAVVLIVRVLAPIPAELEQAAEVLGAPRSTIVRRVTLGLAGPGLLRAALVVLGLCLADVATPLLLGGDARVLVTVIVTAAAVDGHGAAGAALLLAALATIAALTAGAWRCAGALAGDQPVLPRLERPAPATLRWVLGSTAWIVAVGLASLWVIVPLGSLLRVGVGTRGLSFEHWAVFATPAGMGALSNSLLLGLGVAVTGTVLALLSAWIVEGGSGYWGRAVALLARVPIVVPGVGAGVGYLLVFGTPSVRRAGTMLILIAIVVCWELPVTLRVARDVLVRTDRSVEDAAVSLGADRATALTRIVAPALRPVTGWLFGYLFAAGVLAVGTVIVVTGAGRELGALTMLTLAVAGATGAACAVATALLVLAGGAVLLGRAIAGRQRGSTLLA